MKNNKIYDLELLLSKYSGDDVDYTTIQSSQESFYKLLPCLTQSNIKRDVPDGFYLMDENTLLIMEHFRFDATKVKKKKGSETFRELDRISRENKTNDILHCSINIDNYWKNLKNNYKKHSQSIENYVNQLKSEGILKDNMKYQVAFFIEDATELGCVNKHTGKRVNAIFCDQFIDLFEEDNNVDYIYCFSEVNSTKKVLFTDRNSISELRLNEAKIYEIELIDWDIHTYSFKIKL